MSRIRKLCKAAVKFLPIPDIDKIKLIAMGNAPQYPSRLNIEPTMVCNLKCIMCGGVYWNRQHEANMSFELFKKIVSQFSDLQFINIQGIGEPLINKDIIDMIEYARTFGIYTHFYSNLNLLTEEMAERLVKSGHSCISVSLESMEPSDYEYIRRGAKYEKLVRSLRLLQEMKKKYNSPFPDIQANCVLMKYNLPHLPNLVRELRNLGVSQIVFPDLNTDGLDKTVKMPDNSFLVDNSMNQLPPDKLDYYFNKIKEAAGDEVGITLPAKLKPSEQKTSVGFLTCKELWKEPFVTCDGYMTACCLKSDKNLFNMGNFNEMTFKEIWLGEAYQKMRYQHLTNQHPEPCRNCQQLYYSLLPLEDANKPVFLKYFLGDRAFSTKIRKK